MRTVITGGAGFIGSAIARTLLRECAEGDEIILVDNLSRDADRGAVEALRKSRHVCFVEADLSDPSSASLLPDRPDRVYHMAGIVGVDNVLAAPARVMWVNTSLAANVFHWFVDAATDGARLLFASTSEVYAGAALAGLPLPIPTPETVPAVFHDPASPRMSYGVSKLWGEMYGRFIAQARQRFVAIERYHNVYGPAMGFSHVIPQVISRAFRRESPFRIIGADDTRSFCWVGDAAEASRLVLESPALGSGDVVHIGDSKGEITIRQLYEMIFDLLEWRPQEVEFAASSSGSVPRRCPDVSLLTSLTGFTPRTPLRTGLRDTIDWYRARLT
jgi:UDP-glucuronate decarboxylase